MTNQLSSFRAKRGILGVRVERFATQPGRQGFLTAFGMTVVLTTGIGAQQATPPAASPNAPALDLSAVSLPIPAAGRLVAITNATIMTAVAGGMVLSFPARAAMESAVAEQFPVAALDHLRRNPAPAPLLNAYDFGGYMVWAGHDVFIDGRSELFELAGVLADYVHITKLKPGALKVLANYGVRACLIHPDEPLATLLASQPDWHSVYSDARSTLFVKRQPAERAHPDPEVPRPVLEPPATEASRRLQSADAHQQ